MREILIADIVITCAICWLIYLVSVEKTKRVGMITDLINDILIEKENEE